jgi:hypothetical protein
VTDAEPRWLRRAGRAHLADGRLLVWSVAEGNRGRRWRGSTRDRDNRLIDDLLLEVDSEGRVGRLEATTAAGQLTFHPEADDRSAHGNVVTLDGVVHIALPWQPDQRIEVPWSPVADAVLIASLRRPGPVLVATFRVDLVPAVRSVDVERVGEGRWVVDGRLVVVDAVGLPLASPDATSWPLEDPTVAAPAQP